MGETVCFRCRKRLDDNDELRSLTGTCRQCFGVLLSEGGERLSSFLESLPGPAALVARDHTVLESNNRFQTLAVDHEVAGLRVGDLLDCMYTSTLGKCGETVACLLCHLKRSVEQTWLTGEGLRGVPISYPHRIQSRKSLTVTTEKVGDSVLIMIETAADSVQP